MKKYINPVLYPMDRNMNKLWFIKYFVPCYRTGKLKSRKYYGLINRFNTIEERNKYAEEIIAILDRDGDLPNYQGVKNKPAEHVAYDFASIGTMCREFLQAQKHLKPRTISQYNSRINVFLSYLSDNNLYGIKIGEFNVAAAQNFLNWLKQYRRAAGKTYNDYKSLLSEVWRYHIALGRIDFNPWHHIKSIAENTKHLESYPEQVRLLIRQHCPTYDHQLWLFIQFVYYCALRPHAELRKIQLKHIDFKHGYIHVPASISKTGKARSVHIFDKLLDQIKSYQNFPADWFLFSHDSPGAESTSINHFQRKWKRFREFTGIPAIYKIYGSKHTSGKQISVQFNEYITQQHFGHKSSKSTAHYTADLPAKELAFLKSDFPEF